MHEANNWDFFVDRFQVHVHHAFITGARERPKQAYSTGSNNYSRTENIWAISESESESQSVEML